MSDGETGSKKSRVKTAWEALAVMERLGFESVEEMEAAMAKIREIPTSPDAVIPVDVPIGAEAPTGDPVADDLYWITADHYEIHFVLRKRTMSLRPARMKLSPPIEGISINPYGGGEWNNMPFSLRHDDHEKQRFLRIKYSNWNYFCLTRELAEDMYSDARWPVPSKAVISHEEFRGWSRASNRATGVHRDLSNPDVLREAARRLLQRFAGQLFVNSRHHRDLPDVRVVNPYGNHLDEIAIPVPKVVVPPILVSSKPQILVSR